MCCYIKYVMVNDEMPTKQSPKNHNYDLILPLFHEYRYYDGSIPLRILGRVILFCHELQERVLIKKYKKLIIANIRLIFAYVPMKLLSTLSDPIKSFAFFGHTDLAPEDLQS